MMTRLLLLISPFLIASGCASVSPMEQNDVSQDLFVRVLEAPAPQRAEAMAQLESEYAQSPWTSRARSVDELLNSCDTFKNRIDDLERRNSSQLQKNRALEEEIARLRNDLEKLKQLIIDMEKRSAI